MCIFSVCCSVITTVKSKSIFIILQSSLQLFCSPSLLPPSSSNNYWPSRFLRTQRVKMEGNSDNKKRTQVKCISQLLQSKVISLNISQQGRTVNWVYGGGTATCSLPCSFPIVISWFLTPYLITTSVPSMAYI